METNNIEKDVIATVRTPSVSTVSPQSTRYFDARSWEENRDVVSLRIQSPASELYLDEEFSPSTIIGSPNSIVDIKTPQISGDANCEQGEERVENDVNRNYINNDNNQSDTTNRRYFQASNRLLYVIFSILFGFIFIIGILGAFFYYGSYPNWNDALLQELEFNVDNINVEFIPEKGYEKMEMSLLVKINAPNSDSILSKNSNIHLSLENAIIEWNKFSVATIISPQSLDIFESDKLDVMIETTSNATNMLGINGVIEDILKKGFTEVTVNAHITFPSYISKNNLELISKKFKIAMPLRKLITNIQLTDLMLDRKTDHNSNILFSSKASYDYRGRIFVNNLGKIFFGVFHKENYLGVMNIDDSELLAGEKRDIKMHGTLNMHNFIKDKILVRSLRPSLDFGEITSHHIPIKMLDLDIHGVGSSSKLLDSAVRSARTSINLAILPPPPLRQIPKPTVLVESIFITENRLIKIAGILKTTFFGYLISNNDIPKIELLIIKGSLEDGGTFNISSIENSSIELNSKDEFSTNNINTTSNPETGFNNAEPEPEDTNKKDINDNDYLRDGIPYHTVTISPYTDKYDIEVGFELLLNDSSQISMLNKQHTIINVNDVQILTHWSFLTGHHKEHKNIDKSQIELEMFNFLPKVVEFSIKDNSFQAQITLQLLHFGEIRSEEISYNGPLKIIWYCSREFETEFILNNVIVNQIATNYILNSNQLIPKSCTIENSKLKVEIF